MVKRWPIRYFLYLLMVPLILLMTNVIVKMMAFYWGSPAALMTIGTPAYYVPQPTQEQCTFLYFQWLDGMVILAWVLNFSNYTPMAFTVVLFLIFSGISFDHQAIWNKCCGSGKCLKKKKRVLEDSHVQSEGLIDRG